MTQPTLRVVEDLRLGMPPGGDQTFPASMLAYSSGGAATFSLGALRDHFSVRRGGMSES